MCKDTNVVWGTMYNELKYRGKKNLESCYKTQLLFFHTNMFIKQRHKKH